MSNPRNIMLETYDQISRSMKTGCRGFYEAWEYHDLSYQTLIRNCDWEWKVNSCWDSQNSPPNEALNCAYVW